MARIFNPQTLIILQAVCRAPGVTTQGLFSELKLGQNYKDFYNTVYRLVQQGFLERKDNNKGICLWITEDGNALISRYNPEKDGIWKLVIFDIPEKQKYVRVVLRAKLKALHFKKWQNSIWVSPYKLDKEIEREFAELAKKFFIRLIKTNDINRVEDLEKLFAQ